MDNGKRKQLLQRPGKIVERHRHGMELGDIMETDKWEMQQHGDFRQLRDVHRLVHRLLHRRVRIITVRRHTIYGREAEEMRNREGNGRDEEEAEDMAEGRSSDGMRW